MIKVYRIEIEPVAKGRPRFTRNGHVYTPKKTKDYEKEIELHLKAKGVKPSNKPCKLVLIFYREMPRSWSKKRKLDAIQGEIKPITRPDLDNYVKAVLDACNGVLFEDDNQVVEIHAKKLYADKGAVEIELVELESEN